jgi:hypothetical protein
MTTQLYNLDVPDEQVKLKLRSPERAALLKTLYEGWIRSTAELRSKCIEEEGGHSSPGEWFLSDGYNKIEGELYESAARAVAPFRKAFKGTISSKFIPFHGYYEERYAAGYFLSGLLDNTDADLLLVDTPQPLYWITSKDKIIVVAEDAKVFAAFGDNIVVNRGEVQYSGNLSNDNSKGLLVNYGKLNEVISTGKGGIHVSRTEVGDNSENSCTILPEDIAKDSKLSALLDEMEKASKAAHAPAIRKLARKIDGHVRKNYKRRVA